METIKKDGKVRGFSMTTSEFNHHDDCSDGACLGCGILVVGGMEPDAREYECESCGEFKNYGMAELLVMGKINITDQLRINHEAD